MKITKITVTGADDTVVPARLQKFCERYPIVEFGILLSRGSIGVSRFPSAEWLSELANWSFHCSGHICGSWVREILKGKWPVDEFRDLMGREFFHRFDRWQLNTHGQHHAWNMEFFDIAGPRGIILQHDAQNDELIGMAIGDNISTKSTKFETLFDLSHGAGILPSKWLEPIKYIPCGYAGGLSPDNVGEQCRVIEQVTGEAEIWIDAETHLRSETDAFDLDKCARFIENALTYK